MNFNAWQFAHAWLSTGLAQSDDDRRPALYRTTLIEHYEDQGVRLVATDSYVLLIAWCPFIDGDDTPPGADVLPDEVAVCRDRDRRVMGLMKYVAGLTKQDGVDTGITVTMGFGEMPGQGQLDGMNETSVWFHVGHDYDERVETPRFEGTYPNWRPVWFEHEWRQTGIVALPADAMLRLGKLSSQWGRAALEFDLGGQFGVAKVNIVNPSGDPLGVHVSGLVMPHRISHTDQAGPPAPQVPPSDEGVHHTYGDTVDQFIADVLGTEVTTQDEHDFEETQRAQLATALDFFSVIEPVKATDVFDKIKWELDVSDDRATEILTQLVALGAIEKIKVRKGQSEQLLATGKGLDFDPPGEGTDEPA